MRNFITLFVSFLITTSCATIDIAAFGNTTISYEKVTRGYRQIIDVSKEKIIITSSNRGEDTSIEKAVSKDDMQTLSTILKSVNLDQIETYPAPSNKSRYDGAAMATLIIKKDDKTYQSQTFDSGNPPAEIKELVESIIELSKK